MFREMRIDDCLAARGHTGKPTFDKSSSDAIGMTSIKSIPVKYKSKPDRIFYDCNSKKSKKWCL